MNILESIVQRLSQEALSSSFILHYEIYAEDRDSALLTSCLDSRGRWMGEINKNVSREIDIACQMWTKDMRFAHHRFVATPEMELSAVWQDMEKGANKIENGIFERSHIRREVRNTGMEIWDPRYPNITDSDRKDVIDWNMEVIKNTSSRAKGKEFRLKETQMFRMFVSSDGRLFNEKSTHFSLYGEVELQVRPPRRMMELHTSRHFADVASRPISVGIVRSLDSGERLTSNLEEQYTVVFESKLIAGLLQSIVGCFSLEKIQNKESFLHRYIGKRIGSTKLHVIDDASLPNGVNTRAFDARGIPSVPLTLICEGKIHDTYISMDAAQNTDLQPTGHMGLDGELWPGNIIVKAGRRSLNMILNADEVVLFCTHLLEPIQFDESTGDIEMLIGCSMLREDKRRRLHGARLKTHLVTLFDSIDEVVSTQRRIDAVDASDWILRNIVFEFLEEDPEI